MGTNHVFVASGTGWTATWGWLLGVKDVDSVDAVQCSFAASWAQQAPFILLLITAILVAAAVTFYLRYQQRASLARRITLGVLRGCLLALLFVTLADPVLQITKTAAAPPLVYLLFDGTDSMNIADASKKSAGGSVSEVEGRRRIDFVRALLARKRDNPLLALAREKDYRLEAYLFEGENAGRLRRLTLGGSGEREVDPAELVAPQQFTTTGRVTAIGAALEQLGEQVGATRLGGVVMVSDYSQNSGPAPVGDGAAPAKRLGAPIYAVGVGATEAINLSLNVQPPPRLKKEKNATVVIKLSQSGLEGGTVRVKLFAKPLTDEIGQTEDAGERGEMVGEETVRIESDAHFVNVNFRPEEAGRWELTAEVDPVDGEIVEEDNRASRKVTVIDDHLRLLFVEEEPSWEWRFVKEVFHRDPDVGLAGFRTFLASADISVRNTNDLFVPTLAMDRNTFFKQDVIILGDVPRSLLTETFCERVREFVSRFGGGLIVLAGPRHGPGQLAGTPLEDMLPVTLDPTATIRDQREFRLALTEEGRAVDFMRLGEKEDDVENEKAWRNLGELPWYFPVASTHSQARILAVHPADTLADGRSPQPLIATRPYGSSGGEVVYIGFNETWRLRRKYGERYYRQFWSQLIHRLGLAHALGAEKRFVPRADREQYRPGEKVTLTIEAYDEDFTPITGEDMLESRLEVDVVYPQSGGEIAKTRTLDASLLKPGVFEARFAVERPGRYRLRVRDPITKAVKEDTFEVTDLSPERRQPVRNAELQRQLALATGGKAYELEEFDQLVKDLHLPREQETTTRLSPLWATPLWFILAIGLLLSEWLTRKLSNLA